MAYRNGHTVYKAINLDRTRSGITRCQSQKISTIFPFLSLPAELRNVIYDLSISFGGIQVFFDEYSKRLCDSLHPSDIVPPRHPVNTPKILLINRQIYVEAIAVLGKKTVRFDHGLFDIRGIREVISTEALQRISSLHITTKGHPTLKDNIIRQSWIGYMVLFRELARILKQGHRLKKLVIDLTDKEVARHNLICWHMNNVCTYRDDVRKYLTRLRDIRGVGEVEILGVEATFAAELKARMESKPAGWHSLPAELRNMVYEYSGDWSDISNKLATTMDKWTNQTNPPPYPRRTTPTILLLNKAISAEASSVLRKKPFNLVLAARTFERDAQVPNILCLVHSATAAHIQHLSIAVESWEWLFALGQLIPALAKKHSLKTFKFHFADRLKQEFLMAGNWRYPDMTVHNSTKILATIRGIKNVSITGDLPAVYAEPLAQIMMSDATVTVLPVLQAVRGTGEVVGADQVTEP